MKYILDASTLIACLCQNHAFHARALAWLPGKDLAVCPSNVPNISPLHKSVFVRAHPWLKIPRLPTGFCLAPFALFARVKLSPAGLSLLSLVTR